VCACAANDEGIKKHLPIKSGVVITSLQMKNYGYGATEKERVKMKYLTDDHGRRKIKRVQRAKGKKKEQTQRNENP